MTPTKEQIEAAALEVARYCHGKDSLVLIHTAILEFLASRDSRIIAEGKKEGGK